ncbi:DUF927 domain-containing protein [Klebsiella aerogenes]|uniref:DUF927 domain-containing protein n=1 Tax=Klebsiella aerogenes TaxID=548 RepID=UPI001BB2ED1C|nr:DUF927 domain-containing protein [Klebsiella aerogenes]QUS02344.1 DUF927 domain-containing protein [Klebsiella aerogenes]
MSDKHPIIETAIALAKQNIPVHPLKAGTKLPVNKGWSSAPLLTVDEVENQAPTWAVKNYNLGMRTGYPLDDGSILLVVDIDIHGAALTEDMKDELNNQLRAFGLDPNNPTVITGSGKNSCHYYVSFTDKDLVTQVGAAKTLSKSTLYNDEGKPCWIIELLGKGKQVVCPPSIHPDTGMSYTLINNTITTAPELLIQFLRTMLNNKLSTPHNVMSSVIPEEILTVLHQHFDTAMNSFFQETNIDALKSALNTISADCDYDTWRNVVWSVRAHNIMDAENLARDWSKTSSKYDKEKFIILWQSYDPTGGIGAGTLYHIATQHGWAGYEKKAVSQTVQPVPSSNQCPCFRVFDSTVYHGTGNYCAGVWHFYSNENEVKGELVCSPVTIDAITCDTSERNFGRLLTITNPLGKKQKWAMPMELLSGNGEPVRAILLSFGVKISSNKLLNMYLSGAVPDKKIRCTPQLGWFEDVFVMPDITYGIHKQNEIVFQSTDDPINIYSNGGTTEEWRNNIAALAVGNSLLTTSICCAFSGPLIEPCHAESGGLHFYGDSSTGKTTLVQVACSVWGSPNYMRSWRATANGIEGAASMFNGTLLALDEISECNPREVGQIIYALGNGQGKQRASKKGAARAIAHWKTAVISSGELTTSATIQLSGENAKAGQAVRLVDISAQRIHGAWDNLHSFNSGAELSEHLKSQSKINYGVIGRTFLSHLVNGKSNLSTHFHKFESHKEFKPVNASGQARRVARRFALLALAGELATKFGLTGWETGYATNTMISMFQSWLASVGNAPLEGQNILQQVRDFVERYSDSRFSSKEGYPSNRFINERAGWWDVSPNGERVYLFTSAGFREATRGYDFKRSIKALTEAGVLKPQENNQSGSIRVRIEGQQYRVYPICFCDAENNKD